MSSIEHCRIRPMGLEDLERVLAWRNHPDISRYMLNRHLITPQEHLNWFKRACNDSSRHLLIVEDSVVALGFVHFSGAESGGIADWGFYAAPDTPKGSGRRLGITALKYAFETLGLHKVCGQALDVNQASIRFHHALGFREEGILRDQHRIVNVYHDLICFGLLRHEWADKEAQQNE